MIVNQLLRVFAILVAGSRVRLSMLVHVQSISSNIHPVFHELKKKLYGGGGQ